MSATAYAAAVSYEPPSALAFSSDECDAIVAACRPWQFGKNLYSDVIFEGRAGHADMMDIADGATKNLVETRISNCAIGASAAGGWGIDFDAAPELYVHVLRYREGQRISWHYDLAPLHPVLSSCQMALTAILSSPSAYEGGVLEVDDGGHVLRPPTTRGTITAYTSACRHRVSRVTRGERIVLISFTCGPVALSDLALKAWLAAAAKFRQPRM